MVEKAGVLDKLVAFMTGRIKRINKARKKEVLKIRAVSRAKKIDQINYNALASQKRTQIAGQGKFGKKLGADVGYTSRTISAERAAMRVANAAFAKNMAILRKQIKNLKNQIDAYTWGLKNAVPTCAANMFFQCDANNETQLANLDRLSPEDALKLKKLFIMVRFTEGADADDLDADGDLVDEQEKEFVYERDLVDDAQKVDPRERRSRSRRRI